MIKNTMTFSAKISKILEANTLNISTVAALEDYLTVGRSAIGAHCAKNASPGSAPGLKTQKRIIEALRINKIWWDTGKGDIFLSKENDILNEPKIEYNQKQPDLNMLFIDTINLLIEKNDRLVQDKNGEINHLRGNENWFKEEFSKLTSKLGPRE